MAADARRAPELSLARGLPPELLGQHLRTASGVAERRLKSCMAQDPAATESPVLQALKARWGEESRAFGRGALERDAVLQESVTQLVNDTEVQTKKVCGAPSGDDALLLMLAARGQGGTP